MDPHSDDDSDNDSVHQQQAMDEATNFVNSLVALTIAQLQASDEIPASITTPVTTAPTPTHDSHSPPSNAAQAIAPQASDETHTRTTSVTTASTPTHDNSSPPSSNAAAQATIPQPSDPAKSLCPICYQTYSQLSGPGGEAIFLPCCKKQIICRTCLHTHLVDYKRTSCPFCNHFLIGSDTRRRIEEADLLREEMDDQDVPVLVGDDDTVDTSRIREGWEADLLRQDIDDLPLLGFQDIPEHITGRERQELEDEAEFWTWYLQGPQGQARVRYGNDVQGGANARIG